MAIHDEGYLKDPMWWFNDPVHQFRIANLDDDYPAEYFPLAEPPKKAIEAIVKYVKEYYKWFSGKELREVYEFGFGAGWTLEAFERNAIHVAGMEGTTAGYDAASINMFPLGLMKFDIRHRMPESGYKYEMAIATEILEHAEIPFHAMAVRNICEYSYLVWFSSEDPEIIHNKPHLHHAGEMPLRYWQNLFAFYGYGCYMLPDHVFQETEGRGRCIFYNKSVYQL